MPLRVPCLDLVQQHAAGAIGDDRQHTQPGCIGSFAQGQLGAGQIRPGAVPASTVHDLERLVSIVRRVPCAAMNNRPMPLPTEPLPADVLDALRRGQTITAIKLLRQSTGLGLKEAKDLVDGHLRSLADLRVPGGAGQVLSPGQVPRSNGMAWWVAAVVIVAAAAAWWFLRSR